MKGDVQQFDSIPTKSLHQKKCLGGHVVFVYEIVCVAADLIIPVIGIVTCDGEVFIM